jgi:adenylate cyclase
LVFLCGVIPALLASALAIYRPALLASLDDTVYDHLLRWTHTRPPDSRVVIVDVDERSLSLIGQWPWRRDVIARLLTRLRDMGSSMIALDVMFAEPDRNDLPQARVALASEGFVPLNAGGQPAPDAALAESLRQGHVLLGYAMTFDPKPGVRTACVLHPIGVAIVQPWGDDNGDAPLFRATGAVCNLPELSRAASLSGFMNAAPDSDGILRRVPLLIELDGRLYPSLALAAVAATTGVHGAALRISNVNSASLTVGTRVVPLDGRGNLLLRYRGKKRTFPYASAADVLNDVVSGETFRDKLVFVGTTALGTREVVATPLDTLFAGVEVQATTADNLLQQDFIRRHELATMLESQAALILGVAVALLVVRAGLLWGTIAGTAALMAVWGGAAWLLSAGVFLSPLFPTIGLVSALALMTRARVTVERRRAETAGHETVIAQRLMVQSLLSLTEVRDAETGRHSRRTQQYAKLLAEELSTHPRFRDYLTPERIELLSSLAPLHDIGKVGVPDRILNKPGALTAEELMEMRKHPVHGRDAILKAERQVGVRDDATLEMAKDIVYTHHERWDGKGYPQGLNGAQIPVAGRLMAIVDVYDAAVTRNVYRRPMCHDSAVDFIVAGKGAQFDPAVVDAFVAVADAFKNVSHEHAEN